MHTVYILINAPGALQFISPKIDILVTNMWANMHNCSVLKPFLVALGNLFTINVGGSFIWEGAFIRINTVLGFERVSDH